MTDRFLQIQCICDGIPDYTVDTGGDLFFLLYVVLYKSGVPSSIHDRVSGMHC